MKTCVKNIKNPFPLPALMAGLGLILVGGVAAQPYTFGPQVQSTNTANITYNSGTGTFQYTDAANASDDFAGLPLTGTAAAYITASNGWTASLTVNLSARTMTATSSQEPSVGMGLFIVINNSLSNTVEIALEQVNDTGVANYNLYGTGAPFAATRNGQNIQTTPLDGSELQHNGTSILLLTVATNLSPAIESIGAVSGVLTFTNNASTDTLTGYYNGIPVGSISLTNWGPNPSLILYVVGLSGEGIGVSAGTDTATGFSSGTLSFPTPLVVTTTSLPNGTNGVAYNQTLTATGGQTPYGWTNSAGVLPPGLTLATNGVISGTPTVNGTNNFTVKVTDALSSTATQALALTVGSPPSVAWIQPTSSSVTVPVGSNVTFAVSVTGTGPFSYQWQHNGTNLPNGIITTVAGNGTNSYSGDGGAATNAELYYPYGVALDAIGNLLIGDNENNRIRKVGTNGIITTVAGNGTSGYAGNGGAATKAELYYPAGVAVDATGNLFIADFANQRIRKVGTNGIITTVAGNGSESFSGDGGAATNAGLIYPAGVAVDAAGNLFIADRNNNRIRKVGTNGIITTAAGNGIGGYSGDGGAATNAELNFPPGVAVDATGNLFIADEGNYRIRKVGSDGLITTIAGNGTYGYSGDGSMATNAELSYPYGVAVDAIGNLFIADFYNNRIRKVGSDGLITTIAGNGTYGYSGDGSTATNAELRYPCDVAVDTAGNLFIADNYNNRIRKVVFPGPTLELSNVGFGNAGAYDVVVSSPYGSATSSVVKVVIPPILSAPIIPAGKTSFTFLLSGPSGSNYVLQASTNLSYWTNVSTSSIPVSGSITLTNAISGYNRRFYRVYLQ